ncbi:hypothetical protein [Pseudoalteromonas sp. S558]|uniref:hypothetical protein n=1 Tax=Pseudoalteromonas sp. S558 TaxID=2066515 RepID=UPI00110BE3AF|nr:hypothetical protein [Pseudoalteromonas sp. S558]TMN94117.1 hypothetical protein CWB66_20715 [Pseudoalteromonas sp. S558]
MKVEALPTNDPIFKLKHSLACAAAIVASVFSYSSLAFTILIMLWPYSAVEELGQRVIAFFVGICICILFGVLLSIGKYLVLKIYSLLAFSAIVASLIYIIDIVAKQKGGLSFNGLELSAFFIVLNFILLLFFHSGHLKVSVKVIKRLKRQHQQHLEYLKK